PTTSARTSRRRWTSESASSSRRSTGSTECCSSSSRETRNEYRGPPPSARDRRPEPRGRRAHPRHRACPRTDARPRDEEGARAARPPRRETLLRVLLPRARARRDPFLLVLAPHARELRARRETALRGHDDPALVRLVGRQGRVAPRHRAH